MPGFQATATGLRNAPALRAVRCRLWPAVGLVLLLAGCKTDLYSGLNQREANEMVAILREHGMAADRIVEKDKTLTVDIEETQFADAVELLKEKGYPRQHFASMADVFPGDGLVTSPLQERARMLYALSQELSRTISEIDGVVSARVQVVLPESDPMRQNPTVSSASVFIRHTADAPLDSLVPQIKTLVANSVAGVSYDRVTVVLVPVDNREASIAPGPATGSAGQWLSGKGAAGDHWLIGVLGLLAAASGGGLVWSLYRQRRPGLHPLSN